MGADDLAAQIGSEVRSLVLFATGAIRIVLSTGAIVTAKGCGSTRITAQLPGSFMWVAASESVTLWRSRVSDDG